MAEKNSLDGGDVTEHLVHWAKKINSDVLPEQVQQIENFRRLNAFIAATLGNEYFLPTGSCVEGSKVNTPGDSGDVDVMVVCGKFQLQETDFDYFQDNPAFIFIRKSKMDEPYLLITLLKDLSRDVFSLLRPFVKIYTLTSHSGDETQNTYITHTMPSAVGLEKRMLFDICPEKLKLMARSDHSVEKVIEMVGRCFPKAMQKIKQWNSGGKENKCIVKPEADINLFEPLLRIYECIRDSTTVSMERKLAVAVGDAKTNWAVLKNFLNDDSSSGDDDSDIEANTVESPTMDTGQDPDYSAVTDTPVHYSSKESVVGLIRTFSKVTAVDHDTDDDLSILFQNDVDALTECEEKLEDMVAESESMIGGAAHSECLAEEKYIKADQETDDDRDCIAHNVYDKQITPDPDDKSTCESHNRDGTSPCKNSSEAIHDRSAYVPVPFSSIQMIDFVPAFHCSGWPRTAQEWITRSRVWPTVALRDVIIRAGVHVVAKSPSGCYDQSVIIKCFRLSFSKAEILLADAMPAVQKLCWKTLKAYQKMLFQSEPKILTSYHWKTMLLRFSELKPASWWIEDNLQTSVVEIINSMVRCLQSRDVPHYFVTSMNLIANADSAAVSHLVTKLETVQANTTYYLREFIQKPQCTSTSAGLVNSVLDDLEDITNSNKQVESEHVIDDVVTGMCDTAKRIQADIDREDSIMNFADGVTKFMNDVLATNREPGDNSSEVFRNIFSSCVDSFSELLKSSENNNSDDDNDDGIPEPSQNEIGHFTEMLSHRLKKEQTKPDTKSVATETNATAARNDNRSSAQLTAMDIELD